MPSGAGFGGKRLTIAKAIAFSWSSVFTAGDGAQITAMSAVKDSVPAGARWGGFFAKPTKQWFREILAIERLVRSSATGAAPKSDGDKDEGRS